VRYLGLEEEEEEEEEEEGGEEETRGGASSESREIFFNDHVFGTIPDCVCAAADNIP
jgi:hypothetical protein